MEARMKDSALATAHLQSAGNSGEITRDAHGRFGSRNLYAFRPGQSGNLKGRPKTSPITTALENDLEAIIPQTAKLLRLCRRLCLTPKVTTWADLIARSLVIRALKQTDACVEIANRVEGKPVAKIEYGGWEGAPIKIHVVYEDSPLKD
jgi:hypothetical protein